MIHTLSDFTREYSLIVNSGWILTHRPGPTGVGKTLEDLLGIKENNKSEPDFGEYELKSGRNNAKSMLTILTKSPEPFRANEYLRQKFGYSSNAYSNANKVLHATLTATHFVPIYDTGNKLSIYCTDERISIVSQCGIENVYWSKDTLHKQFVKKYRNKLVYVKADCRGSGKAEEFKYTEAYEIQGFDYYALIELLEMGKIWVDLRIGQYPNGKIHDHGTGFRIRECDQYLLFKDKRRII